MALCKFCGVVFQWGKTDDGWVPLVPIDSHEDLDRTYQDEDGNLRADHRQVCVNRGGPAVRVARLARKIPAKDVLEPPTARRKRKEIPERSFDNGTDS